MTPQSRDHTLLTDLELVLDSFTMPCERDQRLAVSDIAPELSAARSRPCLSFEPILSRFAACEMHYKSGQDGRGPFIRSGGCLERCDFL